MTETGLAYCITFIILAVPVALYLWRAKRREARISRAAEEAKLYSKSPKAQHPQIDLLKCIGCGACVLACPEGDVLAVFSGKTSIIQPHKCVGHGLCEQACPVGAITMIMAAPSMSANLPYLTIEHETNIPNLFIAGELGGLALIKNAVNQGRECIDTICSRIRTESGSDLPEYYDVCIVGAGPAGISASLHAIEKGLRYLTLEQGEIGGAVAKYPRQKLVMTSPVEFPIYGKFRKMTLSKEKLLEFWQKVGSRADFKARTNEKVEEIRRTEEGPFAIVTPEGQYNASAVILAIGRNGTPRKLGVSGEDLPKVMYSLIDTDGYQNSRILIVGGGDSAVEAAMGLAAQKATQVSISYRKERFFRLKERNSHRIEEAIGSGKIQALFNSNVVEIKERSVILKCGSELQEIENDYIWIFIGGTPPNAFLEKIGVRFGSQEQPTPE